MMEHDSPAVVAAKVSVARAGMPAEDEPREEHHSDDEHHTGDDADPRQYLIEPAWLPTVANVATDRRWRRRIVRARGGGRMLGCLGHVSDNAHRSERLGLNALCISCE